MKIIAFTQLINTHTHTRDGRLNENYSHSFLNLGELHY